MALSYISQHLYASSGPKRTELFPFVAGKTGELRNSVNLAKLAAAAESRLAPDKPAFMQFD